MPGSLDATDREQIARDFARHLVDRYGVAVSVALHEPSRHGDDRNYHAHILFSTRRIDGNGFGAKTRELDDIKTGPQEVIHIRQYAATLINEYLEDPGMDERVDHRSFRDRGDEHIPTEHLGVEASAMERRGEESRIGDENRAIAELNHRIDDLLEELAGIDAEIAAEMAKEFLPETEEPENSLLPTANDRDEVEAIQPEQEPLGWQEQKRIAQSAVEEVELLYPMFGEAEPEQQDSSLSWEERKREAQSAVREVERDYPVAAEQEAQAAEASANWEEQKKAAQDTSNNSIVKGYMRDIQERGEIREYGVGNSWYDRTLTMFENLYYDTIGYIKDTYQKYVGRHLFPSPDRDIDLDR